MKVKIVIMFAVLLISVIGCTPQPVQIEYTFLSQSIDDDSLSAEQQSVFPAGTKTVYLTVNIKNITPQDELKVKWTYLDSGNIIDEQVFIVENPVSGNISFNINIAEGFPSGSYLAEVYLNGEMVQELDFLVQ